MKTFNKKFLYIGVITLFFGVSRFLYSSVVYIKESVMHPLKELLPKENMIQHKITKSSQFSSDATLNEMVSKLQRTKTQYTLDSKDKNGLSKVEDLTMDKQGNVIFLNSSNSKIMSINLNGLKKEYEVGENIGLGEYVNYDSKNSIFRITNRHGDLKDVIFKDNKILIQHENKLNFTPESYCNIAQDTYYLASIKNDNYPIHSLRNNIFVNNFGYFYNSKSKIVPTSYKSGKLVCNQEDKTILMTLSKLPYIFSYHSNGNLKWTTQITNFHTPKAKQEINSNNKESVLYYNPQKNGFNFIQNLVPIDTLFTLVQVIKNKDNYKGKYIDSYLLSNKNGEGRFIGNMLPSIKQIIGNKILSIPEANETNIKILTF